MDRAMNDESCKDHPDTREFYRRKELNRKNEAKRPVTEKIAAVVRLRDFEKKLENTRKANRARRAAKEIPIVIKLAERPLLV